MASVDFIRLMNLIFKKHYKIKSMNILIEKNIGTAAVELLKGDFSEKIESHEDDFFGWVASLKNVYNPKGESELIPVKDTGKYYRELDNLIDEDNTKFARAIEYNIDK